MPPLPSTVSPPMGQTGIRLREALAAGEPHEAAGLVPAVDLAHRIEIVLGAALRDGREGFAAARAAAQLLGAGAIDPASWLGVCSRLTTGDPDRRLDDIAAAWVASRAVPDRWRPEGRALTPGDLSWLASAALPDERVAVLHAAGVSGLALLDHFRGRPLHEAVSLYYRVGTIHALGPRPLLILSLS